MKKNLRKILNEKLTLTPREEEIFEATYDYAFRMGVLQAGKHLMNEKVTDHILENGYI